MFDVTKIRKKFVALRGALNERARRLWAASEARALGWGGITALATATGMSRNTIKAGTMELKTRVKKKRGPVGRPPVRRAGGGRKRRTEQDPTLLADLEALL